MGMILRYDATTGACATVRDSLASFKECLEAISSSFQGDIAVWKPDATGKVLISEDNMIRVDGTYEFAYVDCEFKEPIVFHSQTYYSGAENPEEPYIEMYEGNFQRHCEDFMKITKLGNPKREFLTTEIVAEMGHESESVDKDVLAKTVYKGLYEGDALTYCSSFNGCDIRIDTLAKAPCI